MGAEVPPEWVAEALEHTPTHCECGRLADVLVELGSGYGNGLSATCAFHVAEQSRPESLVAVFDDGRWIPAEEWLAWARRSDASAAPQAVAESDDELARRFVVRFLDIAATERPGVDLPGVDDALQLWDGGTFRDWTCAVLNGIPLAAAHEYLGAAYHVPYPQRSPYDEIATRPKEAIEKIFDDVAAGVARSFAVVDVEASRRNPRLREAFTSILATGTGEAAAPYLYTEWVIASSKTCDELAAVLTQFIEQFRDVVAKANQQAVTVCAGVVPSSGDFGDDHGAAWHAMSEAQQGGVPVAVRSQSGTASPDQ